MEKRSKGFLTLALVLGLLAGAAAHRWYQLLPHNHLLKTGIRDLKGKEYGDYGSKPLSMLQSWHVETSEAISFIDPQNAKWLVPFAMNDWKKADNMNFFYIMSALQKNPKLKVNIAAQCHPKLTLAALRPFNAVFSDVQVSARFTGAVPNFASLTTFGDTGFHPSMKPRVRGNELIIAMPTHPVIVDDLAHNANEPESLDQRGQIGHFFTLFALEIYGWAHDVAMRDVIARRHSIAFDPNSYRNHQAINAAAKYIEEKLGDKGGAHGS